MSPVTTGYRLLAVTGLAAVAAALASPSLLSRAQPGLWEIARSGAEPVKLCVATPAALAQFEHRGSSCTRVVVRDGESSATIHYTCAGGEFGQSQMTLVTPRALSVETQGISGGAPFKYMFQARRVGDCVAH